MSDMFTGAARGARGTVVVVDDNQELVRGLETLLTNAGYRVFSAMSGAGVAQLVTEHSPDVVVMDVMMPGVDGWEALRELRSDPRNEGVAVMMLTAKGTEDAKVRGFTLGADDYLTKPFSLNEFRCRIDALVRRSGRVRPDISDRLPVVSGVGTELLEMDEIVYVEGIHNYTYVHTRSDRFLSRLSLGAIEKKALPGFMRIHRSYVVRLGAVKGYRWVSKSSFKVQMDDADRTELPVSRTLVTDVKDRLRRV
ncbi:MAG: response regulator [Coriobacteriia bacterium]|nr:response regulator [Coriobacteriia bacterium]